MALQAYAAAVGQYGIRLSNLGRREEALKASEEAVAIRRRLADARPDAFLPDLANALWQLSRALAGAGCSADAAAAGCESLTLHAPLLERLIKVGKLADAG